VQINDTQMDLNRVTGSTATGGAVSFAGITSDMRNVSLSYNAAAATGIRASAMGGALFTTGISMQLVDCQLVENRATMTDPADRASGGALHVGMKAKILLLRNTLKDNVAGGPGFYQLHAWEQPFATARLYESAATQIYTQGSLTLDDCDVLDDVGQTGFELPRYSMWFWIVAANGGAVRLLGSRFRTSATHMFDSCMYQDNGSCEPALGGCLAGTDYRDCGTEPPQASGPFGKLIRLDSQDARLEVRRCNVTNLTLHAIQDLDVPAGIVNSTFQPVLDRSLIATVMPSPMCATSVVNRDLCDARALCEPSLTGGVQCSCIGAGLRDKPGTIPDGAECAQDTSIAMLIESHSAVVKVQKPGNLSETIEIVLRAEGDEPYDAQYTISMERTSSLGQLVNTSRWDRADKQRVSMHGHHVIWDRPMSSDSQFALEAGTQKSVVSKGFVVHVRLDCSGQQACVADGDTVRTVIEIGTASSPSSQRALVSITSQVSSLISCEKSIAWVMGYARTFPASTTIDVRLRAIDMDAGAVARVVRSFPSWCAHRAQC
jgi:hypothetical protein